MIVGITGFLHGHQFDPEMQESSIFLVDDWDKIDVRMSKSKT